MSTNISKKQHWLCQIYISAIFAAIMLGGNLLYMSHRYTGVYWAVFLFFLILQPKAWLERNVASVLRSWWGMDGKETRRIFLTSAGATLALSLIAHGFLFANEFFSHDSLHHNSQGGVTQSDRIIYLKDYSASLGRFSLTPYEGFRGPTTYAPWLIGVLFLFWMILCAVFLVRLLNIQSTSGIIIASGLLCTSTALTCTGATYIYCLDEYALSLLLSVTAVWLFQRRSALLGMACMVVSLGFYQPYFCVALVLAFLCVVQDLADRRPVSEAVRRGLYYLSALFCSFILYYLCWTAISVFLNAPKDRLSESLIDAGLSALWPLLKNVWGNYAQYLLNGEETLGALYPIVSLFSAAAIVLWLLGHLLDKDMPAANKGFLTAAVCLMPLAFNLPYILFCGSTADLMHFSNGLFFIFLVCCRERPPAFRLSPPQYRAVAMLLLCVICWRNVIFSNQAYMKKELEKNSTAAVVTRIISRVEAVEGYRPNETPVILYPEMRIDSLPYLNSGRNQIAFQDIASHTGLDWDFAFTNTTFQFRSYVNQYWGYPMLIHTAAWLSDDDLETVQEMPIYPAAGSVALVGENVVIRIA